MGNHRRISMGKSSHYWHLSLENNITSEGHLFVLLCSLEALLTVVKNWKQPNCPIIDD